MQDLPDAEIAQRLRHVIEATHRDAARQDEDVVSGEMHGQALAQLRRVVLDVIVRDLRITPRRERSAQRVRVGAPNLPRLDGLAGLRRVRHRS